MNATAAIWETQACANPFARRLNLKSRPGPMEQVTLLEPGVLEYV